MNESEPSRGFFPETLSRLNRLSEKPKIKGRPVTVRAIIADASTDVIEIKYPSGLTEIEIKTGSNSPNPPEE